MATRVCYWERQEDKKRHRISCVCFVSLFNRGQPSKVYYVAPIKEKLSNKAINFYINFLKAIFDDKIFNYKVSKKFVSWELDTKKLSKCKALLYLTAFRYVNEFPNIVKEFHKASEAKDSSLTNEELFTLFLDVHQDIILHRMPMGLYGHGLICSKFTNRISIEQFKKNLLNEQLNVQSHFFSS